MYHFFCSFTELMLCSKLRLKFCQVFYNSSFAELLMVCSKCQPKIVSKFRPTHFSIFWLFCLLRCRRRSPQLPTRRIRAEEEGGIRGECQHPGVRRPRRLRQPLPIVRGAPWLGRGEIDEEARGQPALFPVLLWCLKLCCGASVVLWCLS